MMGGGALATWSQFASAIGEVLYGFAPWIIVILAITVVCALVDYATDGMSSPGASPGSAAGEPSPSAGPAPHGGGPGEAAAEPGEKPERKPKKPEKSEESPDESGVKEPRQMKDPELGPPPPPIWDD